MMKVVVVEEDKGSQPAWWPGLRLEGFQVASLAPEGRPLDFIEQDPPDLVIVDLLQPGDRCQQLLAGLRARRTTRTTPVIVVAGTSDRAAFRRCMELGADDYITKPFELNELVTAVHVQLRKRSWLRDAGERGDSATRLLAFGDLVYDQERRCLVTQGGTRRVLTASEARLMACFLDNSNRVLDRETLLQAIGRPEALPEDRSIDVLVGRLRRKVEADPRDPKLIQTVRSVGYVLSCDVKAADGAPGRKALSA